MDFKGRNKVSPEFSMASMTDIVFLLLIFFMLTSTLVTVDALDLVLPKAKGKTEHKQNEQRPLRANNVITPPQPTPCLSRSPTT